MRLSICMPVYDCGDFANTLAQVQSEAAWSDFAALKKLRAFVGSVCFARALAILCGALLLSLVARG